MNKNKCENKRIVFICLTGARRSDQISGHIYEEIQKFWRVNKHSSCTLDTKILQIKYCLKLVLVIKLQHCSQSHNNILMGIASRIGRENIYRLPNHLTQFILCSSTGILNRCLKCRNWLFSGGAVEQQVYSELLPNIHLLPLWPQPAQAAHFSSLYL